MFYKSFPLLIPFYKLTCILQNNKISCVDAILVVEHFIKEINKNIIQYGIPESGNRLIQMIQKRLLLNKNIQLYQLASLLTPDGIVRYREIKKNNSRINSLVENSKEYWHELDNILLCDQSPKFKFDPIDKYIINEMGKNIKILKSLTICKKTISDAKKLLIIFVLI